MQKGNIVDLTMYQDRQTADTTETPLEISEDLGTAIQKLIQRLRELGPLQIIPPKYGKDR